MKTLPEDVLALARSLYFKDDGKALAGDWKAVCDRIRQVNDRFRGGSDLARGFIDDFFMTELGAKANVRSPYGPAFSFEAAMDAAMKQAEWMAEVESVPAGQHDAGRVLLDWYADNVGRVTRGGHDRSAVPANEDGSGLPPRLSEAEAWLHMCFKEIDPDVSAGAIQTVVKSYLQTKASSLAALSRL